jgi:hypothetical protein
MKKLFNLNEALYQKWEYEGAREICGLPNVVTPPPYTQGDQASWVIQNVALTAQITTSSAVTLLTAPANGTYRISVAASQTVLGAGSPGATTFIPTVVFTDPNSTTTSSQALATFATGATNGALGYIAPATVGTQSLIFRAKSGTAIQVSVAVTGGGGSTNPTVQIQTILESLSQ